MWMKVWNVVDLKSVYLQDKIMNTDSQTLYQIRKNSGEVLWWWMITKMNMRRNVADVNTRDIRLSVVYARRRLGLKKGMNEEKLGLLWKREAIDSEALTGVFQTKTVP